MGHTQLILKFPWKLGFLPLGGADTVVLGSQVRENGQASLPQFHAHAQAGGIFPAKSGIGTPGIIVPLKISQKRDFRKYIFNVKGAAPAWMTNDQVGYELFFSQVKESCGYFLGPVIGGLKIIQRLVLWRFIFAMDRSNMN